MIRFLWWLLYIILEEPNGLVQLPDTFANTLVAMIKVWSRDVDKSTETMVKTATRLFNTVSSSGL